MTIGVFDSGLGGLTILRDIASYIPDHKFIYYGDNLNAPYGELCDETIYKNTLSGVKFLFNKECSLVILACNTASAVALRRLQNEWLPYNGVHKKRILGIFVPVIENITGICWTYNNNGITVTPEDGKDNDISTVGLFATPATVNSKAFERETSIRKPSIRIKSQACGGLVEAIEQGNVSKAHNLIEQYVHSMYSGANPDIIVLGCTHYPIMIDYFRKLIPYNTKILNQGIIVAKSCVEYLKKHRLIFPPDISTCTYNKPHINFYTSDNTDRISQIASLFYKDSPVFQQISST